jgi:hypothetical protein
LISKGAKESDFLVDSIDLIRYLCHTADDRQTNRRANQLFFLSRPRTATLSSLLLTSEEIKVRVTMVAVSSQQLLQELSEHNDFFDMIVDMIPQKLYIAGNSGDDFNPSKYYKKQNTTSKEARRAQAKAGKRRKFNPTEAETTGVAKARLENTGRDGETTTRLPQKRKGQTPAPDADVTAETTSVTTIDTDTATTGTAAIVSPKQSRIEALQAKLHAKIVAKQGLRPTNNNPDQVSKRAGRRAEKQRRKDEATKRKKSGNSKTSDTTTGTNASATNYKISSSAADNNPAQDLAALDFGRLAGLNTASKDNYQKANKSLANLSKSKNLEKMLADAEAKREKLEELKKGSEQDQAKFKTMQWSDTFKEADGQRVKDDPSKLKKALKRKVAKKTKSQKAWKSRVEQTTSSIGDRQKIRNHNLTARMEGGKVGASLSKKRIVEKEVKEGRLSRAGFEGRKQEFLNGKSPGKAGKEGGKNPKE